MLIRKRPKTESPEELLRRYRDDGDPAALGALFDAEAPGLFRIAVSIAGDAAAADEAVQETFLAVIDAAKGCDTSRPVRPWLVTILKNKLVDSRRRAARVPDPLKLEPRLAPRNPATEADRREQIETVRREIEDLPEPYREVALLRWQYGLTPGEIAHVRGEPPGTVRSTLSRALDRLRRALKTIAPLLIVLGVRPRTGLAAVRETVMAHASLGAKAAATGGIIIGGALVSYTTAVSVLVATFAAGVIATLGVGTFSDSTPPVGAPPMLEVLEAQASGDSAGPEPLRVVRTWVADQISPESLEDKIIELLGRLNGEWHNSFTVGNLLTALDPETVVRVLEDRWSGIEDAGDRLQLMKAFAFQRHCRATDILALGMSDPAPRNRISAAYHLIGIAGRDFRQDLGAYEVWRRETEGQSLDEVLLRTNGEIVAALATASVEEVGTLKPILVAHAWKVRYLKPAADRLLVALEPWLRTVNPVLLKGLLKAADQVSPSEEYLRRVVLDRLQRDPQVAPVVLEFLGAPDNQWAKEDLLRRIRDPFDPALGAVALSLGSMEDVSVVPAMLDARRMATTVEARVAIDAGLERLVGFQVHDWESWWVANRDDLEVEGEER